MPNFKQVIDQMKQKEIAEEQKPYKTIGELEHYIRPYDEVSKAMSGNPKANFTIFSKKVGQDFDLGSGSGLEFETEEEARRTIDEWEKHHKPKQALFDEYGIATPFGEEESARFSEENKVDDIYGLSEDDFGNLVNKAMEKYGIKDRDLAAEFIISNARADENWKRYLAKHGRRNK